MGANSKIEKNFNCLRFLPKNSENSANNRFHTKLVNYSNFYDTFANVWPILMKFRTAKHIRLPKLMSDQ